MPKKKLQRFALLPNLIYRFTFFKWNASVFAYNFLTSDVLHVFVCSYAFSLTLESNRFLRFCFFLFLFLFFPLSLSLTLSFIHRYSRMDSSRMQAFIWIGLTSTYMGDWWNGYGGSILMLPLESAYRCKSFNAHETIHVTFPTQQCHLSFDEDIFQGSANASSSTFNRLRSQINDALSCTFISIT